MAKKDGFVSVENFRIDKVCDQFVAGIGDGGTEGKLTNLPEYHIERPIFKEKAVLEIHISELDLAQKPCYITNRGLYGGSYKRIDDKDIKLSLNEIVDVSSATAKWAGISRRRQWVWLAADDKRDEGEWLKRA